MQDNSRKCDKSSIKVNISDIFIGELHCLISKLPYFVEICVSKVLSPKVGSEARIERFSYFAINMYFKQFHQP